MSHKNRSWGLKTKTTYLFKSDFPHHLVKPLPEVEIVFWWVRLYHFNTIKRECVGLTVVIQIDLDLLLWLTSCIESLWGLDKVTKDHPQFIFALCNQNLEELIWNLRDYLYTIFVELIEKKASLIDLDLKEVCEESSISFLNCTKALACYWTHFWCRWNRQRLIGFNHLD